MPTQNLTTLATLIGDDSHACSFQSLGQYRAALLKAIAQNSALPASVAVPDCDICHGTRRVKEPGCDEGDCARCLSAAPHPVSESAEDRFEHYLQNAIDNAPDPLRRLGEYLSHVIDEDEWATAERMLNGAIVAASAHPVSGEQKMASVQITGHLDEVDAPVWEFINSEARKLGPLTGSIDTYNFARPNGSQPNGVVAVLWNGSSIHAMAVTVRDSTNRTQCVRLLAAPPSAQDVAGLVEALDKIVGCFPFGLNRQVFSINGGQPLQADGDTEFLSYKKVNAVAGLIRQLASDALAAHRAQQTDHSVAVNKMVEGQQ